MSELIVHTENSLYTQRTAAVLYVNTEIDEHRNQPCSMCILHGVFWTSYLNVNTQRTEAVLYVNTEIDW